MDLNGINVVVLRLVCIFLNLKLRWFLNWIFLSDSRWWSLCAELDTTVLSQRVNVCNPVLCACLSKIWCHTMHLVSIVKLESIISPEFLWADCDLLNETKRTENMNISVVFFTEYSLRSRGDQILFCIKRTALFSHKMQIYN